MMASASAGELANLRGLFSTARIIVRFEERISDIDSARDASICARFSVVIRSRAPISSASSSGLREEKTRSGTPAARAMRSRTSRAWAPSACGSLGEGRPGGWSTAAGRVGVGMRGSGTFCSGGDAGAELIAVSQSSSGRGRCAGAPGARFGGSRNEAKSRKSGGASRVCAVWRLAPISGAAASPIGAQTSARPASKEASAPEAGLRGFRPSSTETAIMYGPMLRRSPSRKRCGASSRYSAPLTKVPFVETS